MAILRLGAIITQISGKVGGQSIVNGAQGTYLKNIGNQTKSPSPAQSIQRSLTGVLMQTWRTLTEAQVKTYEARVGEWTFKNRVGQIHVYTAFQIFMLLNQGRLLINRDINLQGSSPETIIPATTVFSHTTNSQLIINIFDKTAGQSYVVWMSPPVSQGVQNVHNLLRKIAVIEYDEGQVEYDITKDYLDVYGSLASGQRIGYSIQTVITDSGQRNEKPISSFILIS